MAGKPTASHHHHPPHPHVNVDQPHSGGWVVEGEVPIVFLGQRLSQRLGTPHCPPPFFFNSKSFFACVSPSFCQQFWVSYTSSGCLWFYGVSLVFYGLLRGSRLIVSPPWAEHLPGDSEERKSNSLIKSTPAIWPPCHHMPKLGGRKSKEICLLIQIANVKRQLWSFALKLLISEIPADFHFNQ